MKSKALKNGLVGLELKKFEELHEDSKTWLSEIEFIEYEIQFLKHLLGEKYVDCLDAGLNDNIKEFTNEIFNKKDTLIKLKEIVFEHEKLIIHLIDREVIGTDKIFLQTHHKFDIEIKEFISNYKNLKMQIFKIVENILESKGRKKLT